MDQLWHAQEDQGEHGDLPSRAVFELLGHVELVFFKVKSYSKVKFEVVLSSLKLAISNVRDFIFSEEKNLKKS